MTQLAPSPPNTMEEYFTPIRSGLILHLLLQVSTLNSEGVGDGVQGLPVLDDAGVVPGVVRSK